MEQEKVEEIVRLVSNRDEGAVKVAIDAFVKQHPTLLLEFVNRILQDDISSQVRTIDSFSKSGSLRNFSSIHEHRRLALPFLISQCRSRLWIQINTSLLQTTRCRK